MLILSKRKIFLLLIALFWAIGIVVFPWETIRNYDFIDLSVNIEKFKYPQYYFGSYTNLLSLKSFLSDEPLWFYLNIFMKNIGFSGELFFSSIAIITLFIFNNYVLSKNINPLYLLLFINPVFLDFVLSQQRNALCFALLVLFLANTKIYKYLFLLFLPLIHSISGVLILIFFTSEYIFKNINKKYIINILIFLVSIIISYFLAYGRIYLNSYTDDNRFGEYEVGVNSITYIIPWIFYLIWFVVGSKVLDRNYILLIFFISTYIFLTFFEFYGVRFLAMAIPFLVSNIINLKYRNYFIGIFVAHQVILLSFWLKIS